MAQEVAKKRTVTRTGRFLWLSNEPALDFVNTEIVGQGRPADLLKDRQALVLWLHETGLLRVPKSTDAPLLDAALRAARDYRRILRSGVQALVDTGRLPEKTIAATNAFLSRKAARDLLVPDGERFVLNRRWDINSPEDICAPIAQSFARFISTADLTRIRRCRNPECVLFFYDLSKSGTRSWCSLDMCGNRLRVAAFRKRRKGQ